MNKSIDMTDLNPTMLMCKTEANTLVPSSKTKVLYEWDLLS